MRAWMSSSDFDSRRRRARRHRPSLGLFGPPIVSLLFVALFLSTARAQGSETGSEPDVDQQIEALQDELRDLREAGRYDRALEIARAILALRIEHEPADSWRIINARLSVDALEMHHSLPPEAQAKLAEADTLWASRREQRKKGEYVEAAAVSARILDLQRAASTRETSRLFEALVEHAVDLDDAGEPRQSFPLAEESLAMVERLFGDDHPDVARALNLLATLHQNESRFDEAEECLVRSLAIRRKGFGARHLRVATVLNNLGVLEYRRQRLERSVEYIQEALEIRREQLDPDDRMILATLMNIAVLQHQNRDWAGAERSLTEVAEVQRRTLGRHPDLAQTLCNLAILKNSTRDLDGAKVVLEEAYDICLDRLGPEHPLSGRVLDSLAQNFRARGDYAAMEPILRRSLASAIGRLGEEHAQTANTRLKLGSSLLLQSRYREALAEFRECHRVSAKLFGDEDSRTLLASREVGLALQSLQDHPPARAIFDELLTHYRSLGDAGREDEQRVLHDLANLEKNAGRFDSAREYYQQCLALRRELGLEKESEHARLLSNMADIEFDVGNYPAAKDAYDAALEVALAVQSREHPFVGMILSQRANAEFALGNVLEAKQQQLEAIAILEARLGPNHSQVDVAHARLNTLLSRQGRLDQVESLTRERLARLEARVGPDGTATLIACVNLAKALGLLGRSDEAEPYLREAIRRLEAHENIRPRDRRVLAVAYGELAGALHRLRDHDGSLAALEKSLEHHRLYAPENSAFIGSVMAELAGAHLRAGAVDRAREYLEPALRIANDPAPGTLESESIWARTHQIYAALLQEEGRWEEAERTLRDVVTGLESRRGSVRGTVLELDRFEEGSGLYEATAHWAVVLGRLGRPAEAFEALERGRARATLDLLTRARQLGNGPTDDASRRAVEATRIRLTETETRLTELLSRDDVDTDVKKERVRALQQEVGELRLAYESALERIADAIRRSVPGARPQSIEALRAGLRPNEVYLAYTFGEKLWMAILVPAAGEGEPRAFELTADRDANQQLLRNIVALRRSLAAASPEVETLSASVGQRLLPAELRAALASARRVVLLTDDPLSEVPVETLAWGSSTWLDQPFETVRVSSASLFLDRRELLARRRSNGTPDDDRGSKVVALGNPTFLVPESTAPAPDGDDSPPVPLPDGVLLEEVAADSLGDELGLRPGDVIVSYGSRKTPNSDALAAVWKDLNETNPPAEIAIEFWRQGAIRTAVARPGRLGVRPSRFSPDLGLAVLEARTRGADTGRHAASALDQVRLFGGRLAPLPGTGREVDRIVELARSRQFEVVSLDGGAASVPRFREAIAGSHFVHLATHGLLGSSERPSDASLAFASPATPSAEDDGFLTLEEMLHGWAGELEHSELVVLSACDSSRTSDRGRRACSLTTGIFYAGAPSVVASQWKVDDDATSLLMGRFYENLWGVHDGDRKVGERTFGPGVALSKPLALEEAQNWLRSASSSEIRSALGIVDDEAWNQFVGRLRGRPRVEASVTPSRSVGDRPYAHPYYWAAFTLIGCGD